jgi:phage terminase large subunit-like protein
MLMLGMRLGNDPRVVVTTTPRPTKLIRALVADPTAVVTRGSTYENRTNLAPAFLQQIIRKYEGTRLGRQELEAEILDDVPGALWTRGVIEASRACAAPPLLRVVVAIDPAATSSEDADETGIIVAGSDKQGQAWVLADASGRYPPAEWAKTAIAAYRSHRADRVVAEVNNGGEMVEATLRVIDPNVSFAAVRAARGKLTRAEPVAALLRAGPGASPRCLPATRRSDVRFCASRSRRFRPASHGLLARPGRRAGVGADRPFDRTDVQSGHLRPLPPARQSGVG